MLRRIAVVEESVFVAVGQATLSQSVRPRNQRRRHRGARVGSRELQHLERHREQRLVAEDLPEEEGAC
jgi:hypothetical protein